MDPCESRDLQKVVDLTKLPYEVANSSDYFDYYAYFINRVYDDTDVLTADTEFREYYDLTDYEYDPSKMYIFPNQTQYFKLREFLANSANERNRQAIPSFKPN